jgi:hypothetical protein
MKIGTRHPEFIPAYMRRADRNFLEIIASKHN